MQPEDFELLYQICNVEIITGGVVLKVPILAVLILIFTFIVGCSPSRSSDPNPTAVAVAVQATLTAVADTNPEEVPPTTQAIMQETLELAPTYPDILGSWEQVYGPSYSNTVRGTGAVYTFYEGDTVTVDSTTLTYEWLDDTHLKIYGGDGTGRVYDFQRASNGFTLTEPTGAGVMAFMPYVELPVAFETLEGTWNREQYGMDASRCFYSDEGKLNISVDFTLDADGHFQHYSAPDGLSSGYEIAGNILLADNQIQLSAEGNKLVKVWGEDTVSKYPTKLYAVCEVSLLTRARMHLRGEEGGETIYLRSGYVKDISPE